MDIQFYTADWQLICDRRITVSGNSSSSRSAPQLAFDAYPINQEVQLEWLTNSGYRVSHFEIEHSSDGDHYTVINEQVNDNIKDNFEYHSATDTKPSHGTNYYRVKEVYLDGTFKYTSIETVRFLLDLNKLNIFPNPAQENLFVTMKPYAGKQGLLTLRNQFGQVVKQLNLKGIQEDLLQIDISQLDNGLYFMNVEIANIVMPILIVIFCVFLVWFSKNAISKGWIS